jgi:DNA-binding MarR family transcriptional regulator
MKDRQKVLRLITTRAGISFRDLLRASSLTKKQLEPALERLLCEGTVRREKDGCLYV